MSVNTFNLLLQTITRKILPSAVRRALGRCLTGSQATPELVPASHGYEVIEGETMPGLTAGWQDPAVAQRQHQAFEPLLNQMYKGKPREDFVTLAEAVELTGLKDPSIIEVGCGSGWNSEVMAYLLKRPVRYIGLDHSRAMASLGKACYPGVQFVVGDAARLPFQDNACDILLSGTVLMHVLGYEQAIAESRRVARRWSILHGVPVMQNRSTAIMKKLAYGAPVVEVVFNENALLELTAGNGMEIREVFNSFPYDLQHILGEPTYNRTYLCEII